MLLVHNTEVKINKTIGEGGDELSDAMKKLAVTFTGSTV